MAVGVGEGGDPEAVADEGGFGCETAGTGLVIDGEGVVALEADGDPFSLVVGGDFFGAVLLEHEGGSAELEPAPADFVVDDPLVGALEAEAVDVEAEGGFDVGDPEERDGLLDVGCPFSILRCELVRHGSSVLFTTPRMGSSGKHTPGAEAPLYLEATTSATTQWLARTVHIPPLRDETAKDGAPGLL